MAWHDIRTGGESHRVISGLECSPGGFEFLAAASDEWGPWEASCGRTGPHGQPGKRPRAFPLAAVIMEMSEELKARAMTAEVQLAPRETK